MGMFDTINGKQVKCFPDASLRYFETGDKVPYKGQDYNYGGNFVILDLNPYPDSDITDYDYILHIIVDGKVKNTYVYKIGDIDWSVNNTVVSYSGILLNIKNNDDVKSYIKAQKDYWKNYEKINNKWDELFKECMHLSLGLGLLDKNSEERKAKIQKIKELQELMRKEKEKIKPQLEKLADEHSIWFIDNSNLDEKENNQETI